MPWTLAKDGSDGRKITAANVSPMIAAISLEKKKLRPPKAFLGVAFSDLKQSPRDYLVLCRYSQSDLASTKKYEKIITQIFSCAGTSQLRPHSSKLMIGCHCAGTISLSPSWLETAGAARQLCRGRPNAS